MWMLKFMSETSTSSTGLLVPKMIQFFTESYRSFSLSFFSIQPRKTLSSNKKRVEFLYTFFKTTELFFCKDNSLSLKIIFKDDEDNFR